MDSNWLRDYSQVRIQTFCCSKVRLVHSVHQAVDIGTLKKVNLQVSSDGYPYIYLIMLFSDCYQFSYDARVHGM